MKSKATKSSMIGIIGLGYVGIPFFINFSKKGCNVIGYDKDVNKIRSLKLGRNYLPHLKDSDFNFLKTQTATSNISELKSCNTFIICLPTPIKGKKNQPDLSHINSFFNEFQNIIKKGDSVILVSTVYSGFTREVIASKIQKLGYKIGKDIFLSFSPERENPGDNNFELTNTPRLLAGYSSNCLQKSKNVLSKIVKNIHLVTSLEVAETSKLIENLFRSVNIGFVNEIKIYCDALKIDINEVLDAANTKPFGYMKFEPGPGVGGHCIPVDPYYLLWDSRRKKIKCEITEKSLEQNNKTIQWILKKIKKKLANNNKSKSNKSILVIGIAYKKNLNDNRNSTSLKIFEKLCSQYHKVYYHDKYIPSVKVKKGNKIITKNSLPISEVKKFSASVILTDHDYINYENLRKNSKIIFDSRNVYKGNFPNVIKI